MQDSISANSAWEGHSVGLEPQSQGVLPNHPETGQNPDSVFIIEHYPVVVDRVRVYEKRVRQARSMGRYLLAHDHRNHACKLLTCANAAEVRYYTEAESNAVRLVRADFCQQPRLCAFCASRRGGRHAQRAAAAVMARLDDFPNLVPYLVTLTSQNRESLRSMFREQLDAYESLLQRRRNTAKGQRASVFAEFDGGIFSWEVKRGSGSGLWHLHAHGICLGPPGLTNADLYPEWSEVLGYTANSDLRPLRSTLALSMGERTPEVRDSLVKELCEVFKYALKFSDLEHADHLEAWRVMFNKQMIRRFGSLYRVELPEEYADRRTDLVGMRYERFLLYLQWETETYSVVRSGEGVEDGKNLTTEGVQDGQS